MPIAVTLKASSLWVVILLIAIINGAVREKVLIPAMGTFQGLIASGIILSCCVFLLAFLATHWYGRLTPSHYWLIGSLWLSLTLVFEFGFGRFVQHKAWAELFSAYTFKGGNIWPIVLVITFVSPWLAARLRGLF